MVASLGNVISTNVMAKTGTVVEKMLTGNGELRKVIQYGKQSPLRRLGIDVVKITTGKTGEKTFGYYKKTPNIDGKERLIRLFSFNKNKNSRFYNTISCPDAVLALADDGKQFSKTLKNIFAALRASKSIMG